MRLVLDSAIPAILALWALLTLLNQFHPLFQRRVSRGLAARLVAWAKRYDACALVPLWTFFAPNPGTRDHDVFYRDQLLDGTLTPWRALGEEPPGWWRVVWNPRKRFRKGLMDMSRALTRQLIANVRVGGDPRHILVTMSYLGLASRIAAVERGPLSARTQFLLASSAGYDPASPPLVFYVSPLFDLR
jgi:hypothetical protein